MPDTTEQNENVLENAHDEAVEASEASNMQSEAAVQDTLVLPQSPVQDTLVLDRSPIQDPYAQASDLVLDEIPQPTGTAPLVLGILSIVFAGIIGLVLGIVGVVKSNDVLKVAPQDGKAKGGRICSIIGIVLSALAFIVAVIMIGLLGIGFSIFGGDFSGVNAAANQKLTELTNPSDAEKADIAANLDTAFASGAGISLSDLGVNSADFSNWLFEDASYSITDTQLKTENGKETATVTADVKAHSILDLSQVLEKKVSAIDVSKLNTTEEYLTVIGKAVTESMQETPVTMKTITFTLTKLDGKWQVDPGADEQIAEQIFAS